MKLPHKDSLHNLPNVRITPYISRFKIKTSNDIDIRAFRWSSVRKWCVFPKKPHCRTYTIDKHRPTVLQWCFGCYGNYAGGSRSISNFLSAKLISKSCLIFFARFHTQPVCWQKCAKKSYRGQFCVKYCTRCRVISIGCRNWRNQRSVMMMLFVVKVKVKVKVSV